MTEHDNDDIGDLSTPFVIPMAGFMSLAAGLFTAGAGVQVIVMVRIFSWWRFYPYVLIFAGLLLFIFGGQAYRARLWAVVVAIGASAFAALVNFVWFGFTFTKGMFTLMPPIAFGLCLLAMVLLAASLPGAKRLSAARKKLMS